MKKIFLIFAFMLLILAVNAQRTQLKVSALPDPIPNFLNTNYTGFVIEKANKVVSDTKEVTYETVITKGTTHETLIFDKNGNFLRSDTVNKPIHEKSNINAAEPSLNKKTNTTNAQPTLNVKNVGATLPEEKVQKNPPDTLYKKK